MDVVGDYHNPCPYKEKAENWDAITPETILQDHKNDLIVERLKKEIGFMSVSSQDYHAYEVEEILQKILEEKK